MRVSVKVQAGAKREVLTIVAPEKLEISVREDAERNRANTRVRQLVARHFGVREKDVRLITGHRRSSKMFEVAQRE